MSRTLRVALAAVLILPATAQAAFPGANGRIAFNWTFGCDGSVIATMKLSGSDLRRLTADPCTVDGAPRVVSRTTRPTARACCSSAARSCTR